MRPLLLSTLDVELAALRRVPVRVLGAGFLVLLAAVTAESTQAVGALLLLGLIAAPAGAAHLLTTRPYRGLALSAAIAVTAMWAGLALSYAVRDPPALERDHRLRGSGVRGGRPVAMAAAPASVRAVRGRDGRGITRPT